MASLILLMYLALTPILRSAEALPQPQETDIRSIYHETGADRDIEFEVFELALKGMQNISSLQDKSIITIIDYSKASDKERFFVIDLDKKQILYKTLVAHGRNSGEEKAESFSNSSDSKKSSLGFFMTAETYYGKHGYSLSLDGLEEGINDNARKRLIVIHGADYVSHDFIKKYGRLGRSWGCPALPVSATKVIIDKISEGSCIFIYGDDPDYLKNSRIIGCE